MNTYTKQHNYLDILDIAVYLDRISTSLNMLYGRFAEIAEKIEHANPTLTGLALSELYQTMDCFSLITDSVYNLKEECHALDNRIE